jgi:cytochrome b involved in lipid metabolism
LAQVDSSWLKQSSFDPNLSGYLIIMAQPAAASGQPVIDWEEVAKHNTKEDCWTVLHGHVWDLTSFLSEHPGGASIIAKFAGFDGTKAFQPMHPRDITDTLPHSCYKGPINPDSPMTDEQKAGPGKKKKEEKKPDNQTDEQQIMAWWLAVQKKVQSERGAVEESDQIQAWWLAVQQKRRSQRRVASSSKL